MFYITTQGNEANTYSKTQLCSICNYDQARQSLRWECDFDTDETPLKLLQY